MWRKLQIRGVECWEEWWLWWWWNWSFLGFALLVLGMGWDGHVPSKVPSQCVHPSLPSELKGYVKMIDAFGAKSLLFGLWWKVQKIKSIRYIKAEIEKLFVLVANIQLEKKTQYSWNHFSFFFTAYYLYIFLSFYILTMNLLSEYK